ncbi:MAG: FtsX-like permease family protein [Bacilli bacterium]
MKKSVLGLQFVKALRSLKTNFKQFISIIFIIAIAVTLYVGLQANYQSIDKRVTDMYKRGNMASLWSTYSLITDNSTDKEDIKNLLQYDAQFDERLILDSKIGGISTNLAISNGYPMINKPSSLYKKGDKSLKENRYVPTTIPFENSLDFFIIDKSVIDRYENFFGNAEVNVGDEMSIVTQTSAYKGMIIELAKGAFTELKKQDPSGIIITDELIKDILDSINKFFDENKEIVIKAKITAFMSHPENIAATNNDSPITIISRDLFMNGFYDLIYEYMVKDFPSLDRESFNNFTYLIPNFSNQYLFKLKDDSAANVTKSLGLLHKYYDEKVYPENSIIGKLIYVTDINTLPSNLSIQNDIQQASALSYVFPIVFLVVAILIVITTITQLILKDRTQIGVMKALGYSNFEIYFGYLLISIILGLIGTLIGVILGPAILPFILDIKYSMLYALDPMTYLFPWLVAFLVIVEICGLIAFITYFIIHKELKATPTECMRPLSPRIKSNSKKPKLKVMRFTSLKIAARNIRVYFTKSLMVIIGVLGCTALLVCGFGIEDTVNYGINHDLSAYFGADIMLNYASTTVPIKDSILNDEKHGKDIERYYEGAQLPCTIATASSGVFNTAIYLAPLNVYDDKVLDMSFPMESVAISADKAKSLNLKTGDSINVGILGKIYAKTVSVIYETFSMHNVFAHIEDVSVPYTEFKDFKSVGFVYLKEGVKDEQKVVAEYFGTLNGISSSSSSIATREKIAGYVGGVTTMTLAIKIFAILLAVICLINLALLNFTERSREIATLKVLGFSLFEIARSLLYETLFLTIVGTVFGLLLGMPMEYLVLSINENSMVSFIYYIGTITYVVSAAISIGTAFIINLVLSLSTNKIKMVESLKSVE